jgi:nucleotide-binding universal stress UspA family protein
MTPVRRVVVAFDGSPSASAALDHAVDVARHHRALLLVLTAVDVDPGIPQPWVHLSPAQEEAVAAAVASAQRTLGTDRVATSVLAGVPADVVLHTLRDGDLAVLGSHSHASLTRLLIGSTSRSIATHAHGPVTVVRGPLDPDAERVVVGVDGSASSAAAARFAAFEAERLGLPLRAVLAMPVKEDATGEVAGPDDPEVQSADATLHEALAGLAVDHPDVRVETAVTQSSPVDALLEHAKGAAQVVVGSRGRGALAAALLGSVGRDLLERAHCTVTVVR